VRLFSVPAIIRSIGSVVTCGFKAARWIYKKIKSADFAMPFTEASMIIGENMSNLKQQSLVLAGRLGEVNVPTLLIWGGRDPVVPVRHAYAAAKVIPDCTVRVFKNRGHNVHRDELKRFSSILKGFLG
jgi:pimeloyl-ACP methyl ester carboxylesterase